MKIQILSYLILFLNIGCVVEQAETELSEQSDSNAVSVRDYGAIGDGITNDTQAFADASREVNRRGGGTLVIPSGQYGVGLQSFEPGLGYKPQPIISISGCHKKVMIDGQGARLIAASGLKFGSFDPQTGVAVNPTLPFYDERYAAAAYTMIALSNNVDVEVRDLDLDGNYNELSIGGQWGDTGWQVRAAGIVAEDNHNLALKRIDVHRHAGDGIFIRHRGLTDSSEPTPVLMDEVRSYRNGRQGFLFGGGIGLTVQNSQFFLNGRIPISTAPRTGVTLYASDSVIRDVVFHNSEFAGNGGVGLLADSGDTSHVLVKNSRFWGSKSWAVWPNRPYMRFENSEIHGPVAKPYGSRTLPESATQFVQTSFDDTPSTLWGKTADYPYLIDLGGGGVDNVRFSGCSITNKTHRAMYIHGSLDAPVIIEDTVMTHQNDTLTNGDVQSVFYGVKFTNVRFNADFSRTGSNFWVAIQAAEFGSSCRVDGSGLTVAGQSAGEISTGTYFDN